MSNAQADLVEVEVAGLSLRAPDGLPRVFPGAHGRLWQWLGDGNVPLISLTVATRGTQIGTTIGVMRHLNWEVDRLSDTFEDQGDRPYIQEIAVNVSGARAASGAVIDGVRSGIRTHNRIVVASDESRMHVIHAMVPDTESGREFAYSLTVGMSLKHRPFVRSRDGEVQ